MGMDTAAHLAAGSCTLVKHSMLPHKESSGRASRWHDSAPPIDSITLQHGQACGAAGCQRLASTQAECNEHCAVGSIDEVKQEEALDISMDPVGTAGADGHAAPTTPDAPRSTRTSWLTVQLCVVEHRVVVSMHAQSTAAHEGQHVPSQAQLAADAVPPQSNPPTPQNGAHSGCQTPSSKAATNAEQPPIVRSACDALGTATACAPAPTGSEKPSRLNDLREDAPEHLTTLDTGMDASAEEWTKRTLPHGAEAAAQSQTEPGASVAPSPGPRPRPHAGSQSSHSAAHQSELLDPSSFKHASPAAGTIDAPVCPAKLLASSTDPISTPQALTSLAPLSAGGLAAGALTLPVGQAAPALVQTNPSAATMPCSQLQTPVPHDSMDDIDLDSSPFTSAIDSGRSAAPTEVAPALKLPAWPPAAGAAVQHAAGMFSLPSSNAPLYSGRAESLLAASGGTTANPSTPHLAAEAHTVGCNTRVGTATASPAFTPTLSFKRRRCGLLHNPCLACADRRDIAAVAPVYTSPVSLATTLQDQGFSERMQAAQSWQCAPRLEPHVAALRWRDRHTDTEAGRPRCVGHVRCQGLCSCASSGASHRALQHQYACSNNI